MFVIGLFCFPVASVMGKGDLGGDIKSGDIWTQGWKKGKLMDGERSEWVTKGTSVRVAKPQFTVGELKVGETIFQVKDDNVQEIVFSVYNRGDNGDVSRDAFREKLAKTKEAIDAALAVAAKPYKPSRTSTAVKIEGHQWSWPGGEMLMEYSISNSSVKNFTAEFIRVTAVPRGGNSGAVQKGGVPKKVTKADLKSRVATKDDGTVYVKDVPMVDQGQKGYCAAAATARILGYYGIDMDQHEVAQLGKSDADKGTDPNVMLKEISKVISGRFGLGIKTWDTIDSVRDILNLTRIYNREAKKMGKPQVNTDGPVLDMGQIFSSYDPEALKEARAANKSRTDKWLKNVKIYIDQGIPILWGVQLGLYKEENGGSQKGGGHLRMIIGYNEQEQKIIFSDSWGVGHEFKSLGVPEAMSMTTHLDVIFPRQ